MFADKQLFYIGKIFVKMVSQSYDRTALKVHRTVCKTTTTTTPMIQRHASWSFFIKRFLRFCDNILLDRLEQKEGRN